MVLRQGKRRIFLACRRHVHPVADTRCHAANHSPAHNGDYPCRLFCGGTGFQTAQLDVLVSRRRQRADACRFRWQPICQTNGYRTPRPTATPRPAARRCAAYPPCHANLVHVLYLQRRNRRHFGRLAILRLVGGLYRHCVVCVNGNLICRRVDLSEIGFEGVGHLKTHQLSLRSITYLKNLIPFYEKHGFKNESVSKSQHTREVLYNLVLMFC